MKIESAKEFIKRKEITFEKELEDQAFVGMKDISRTGKHHFIREDWTFLVQHNHPEKVFVIERLRRVMRPREARRSLKVGDIEYRIGYYIVGKIRKANGRWLWGQFCPLVPAKDLKKLLQKAKKDKTIRRGDL